MQIYIDIQLKSTMIQKFEKSHTSCGKKITHFKSKPVYSLSKPLTWEINYFFQLVFLNLSKYRMNGETGLCKIYASPFFSAIVWLSKNGFEKCNLEYKR